VHVKKERNANKPVDPCPIEITDKDTRHSLLLYTLHYTMNWFKLLSSSITTPPLSFNPSRAALDPCGSMPAMHGVYIPVSNPASIADNAV
jgi:hypothetical protein